MSWNRPVVLAVLDGWGLREEESGNAIKEAETPNMDHLLEEFPNTSMWAHGEHVGLLKNGLGGSEVGHMHIGAGRLVPQMPKVITESIEDGSFFEKDTLIEAVRHAKSNGGKLHVMGLCSDKGIHSLIQHLYGVLELADRKDFEDVVVHMFLDGRDTEPKVAKRYVKELEEKMEEFTGKVATVSGRYYAMDRDRRWDRTKKAYDAIVRGEGISAGSALEAVDEAYERGESDEFVKPTVVDRGEVEDGDSVFIFNFRADRCIQMTRALTDPEFDSFETRYFDELYFASMTMYSDEFDNPVAFKKDCVDRTLGEVIAENGVKQYRIAESEKLAHVTYFFSGRREEPFEGEDRKIFPSPKVDVYDKTPEMRAEAIKNKALEVMEECNHGFVFLNFSNCDMVGHTGKYDAAVKAAEKVDECVGELFEYCKGSEYTLMITADHGNAEEMKDEKGDSLTAHSKNKVPFIFCGKEELEWHENPELYRIAPAVLKMNGIKEDKMSEPLFK